MSELRTYVRNGDARRFRRSTRLVDQISASMPADLLARAAIFEHTKNQQKECIFAESLADPNA
jgi:predicted hydrolase (HD superfamily)